MHLVAVAQLNGFLFSHDGLDKIEIVNARLKMIRQVLSLRDKVSCNIEIVEYKPNTNSKFPFIRYIFKQLKMVEFAVSQIDTHRINASNTKPFTH